MPLIIAGVVAVIIVALIVVVAIQPEDFRLSRSTTVAAPPADIFSQINDFHNWDLWSPWAKLDPTMKTTFAGSAAGEGSTYSWSGNSKVGEGRMTITKSQPPELVLIQLEFLRPMRANNLTEFTFKPEAQETRVTWTMSGKKNFMAKAFHLIMNMEKMVGPDFEKGLAQLKSVVETAKR
jgi:uncharacterized protein YndB with AHSA1/START domain